MNLPDGLQHVECPEPVEGLRSATLQRALLESATKVKPHRLAKSTEEQPVRHALIQQKMVRVHHSGRRNLLTVEGTWQGLSEPVLHALHTLISSIPTTSLPCASIASTSPPTVIAVPPPIWSAARLPRPAQKSTSFSKASNRKPPSPETPRKAPTPTQLLFKRRQGILPCYPRPPQQHPRKSGQDALTPIKATRLRHNSTPILHLPSSPSHIPPPLRFQVSSLIPQNAPLPHSPRRHHRVEAAIEQTLAAHGRAVIIGCHSFPEHCLPCHEYASPSDIAHCIGTDPYHTPEWLAAELEAALQSPAGRVVRDHPFSGSFVPTRYYRKDPRVLSVMIEVNRALIPHPL